MTRREKKARRMEKIEKLIKKRNSTKKDLLY
jgi:hypothetical protein